MRSVGVEEELLLVDGDSGTAVPLGDHVVDQAASLRPDQPVEHELKQEQVEIASSPCEELGRLRAELAERRAVARQSASAHGVDIAAIATNPGKLRPHSTPDERYQRMVAEFGLLAREQLTCGQHIHVSVESRAEGVAVLDRIRIWLPVLLALSVNSPFWQQQDTGYSSFRTVLWGRWPSAGPTDLFGDEAGYDAAVQGQLDSGAALDDGMIYFDARLSANFPTVEIRVADVCTDIRDAVLLAGLARGLVDTAQREAGESPAPVGVPLLRAAGVAGGALGDRREPGTSADRQAGIGLGGDRRAGRTDHSGAAGQRRSGRGRGGPGPDQAGRDGRRPAARGLRRGRRSGCGGGRCRPPHARLLAWKRYTQ